MPILSGFVGFRRDVEKHDERQHRQERLREYASIMLCLILLRCVVIRIMRSRWPSVKDDIGKMAYILFRRANSVLIIPMMTCT